MATSSSTKIAVASAAVAAAVATSVFVSSNSSTSTSAEELDWKSYYPEIPSIVVPSISLNLPEVPKIDTGITSIDIGTNISSETIDIPDTSSQAKEIDESASIDIPDASVDETINGLKEMIENYQTANSFFIDKRSATSQTEFLGGKFFKSWLKIYEQNKTNMVSKIDSVSFSRMISEIRMPKSNEQLSILKQNLSHYKELGYDSVLISFDGSESVSNLDSLCKFVKQFGFKICFAFGGKEDLKQTVFIDPELLKSQIKVLSSYSVGMFLAWRRTSAHLFIQDVPYINFISNCARESNSNIEIYGELYFGNNFFHDTEGNYSFVKNDFANSSGVILSNFGFSNVNIRSIVNVVAPKEIGEAKRFIGLVIGEIPYYLTRNNRQLTLEDIKTSKEKIERRFMKYGCVATVTLHDDGSDGVYQKTITNNLSETLWSDLK